MIICGGCGVIGGCACHLTNGNPTAFKQGKKKVVPPKPPPLTDQSMTVDDAWILFGITKKRGTKEDVKRLYLAFVAIHHPDKHPNDQARASAQLVRANAAWTLLQKHCKW
jgi:hypothetical protein